MLLVIATGRHLTSAKDAFGRLWIGREEPDEITRRVAELCVLQA